MLELSGTLAGKDVYLITGVDSSYGDIDDYVVSQADLRLDYESPVHFNGDDAVGLFKDDVLLDSVGTDGPSDIGIGWEVCGVENATRRHTLIKKSDKSGESDWSVSAGTNADNCHWIVKDEGDFTNAGFHNQEVKNVSVPNGISGGFTIDGQSKPTLTLERGKIYRFDTSSSTMSSHPIHFGNTTEESSSTTVYGTQVGTSGTTGSHYLLEVTDEINDIYYFCGNHTGMGGSASITNASNTAPELVVPTEVYTLPSNYVYVDEGTKSVADFSANDAEGDSLSYFVTGEDESSFEISTSGALAFVNTPSYTSKKEYSLTVTSQMDYLQTR